jgi:RND superfamily putative drug exporter
VAVSLYLILSVLFSYLTTLGGTFLVFWLFNQEAFAGLDWKVPLFLFTILVAVGEDYNIFLVSRVEEERRTRGPVQGVLSALARTGRIISTCGFIMAGTFAALFAGSFLAMKELGFALAVGVLLDTLVVRPILVPTFLILLQLSSKRAPARVETLGEVEPSHR